MYIQRNSWTQRQVVNLIVPTCAYTYTSRKHIEMVRKHIFLTERIKWSSCVFQHSRRPLNHKHVSGESHDWRIAVAPSETFDTALAAAANRVKHSMLEVALCL